MSAEIMAALARIESKVDALAAKKSAAPTTIPDGGAIAPASELDSKYGDPVVKKDPKRWEGASFAGCKYSECPPDFLDALAGLLDWQADKDSQKGTDDGNKYAGYARKDAARARGWAKRKREGGWKPAPTSNAALFGKGNDFGPPPGDDDIPF